MVEGVPDVPASEGCPAPEADVLVGIQVTGRADPDPALALASGAADPGRAFIEMPETASGPVASRRGWGCHGLAHPPPSPSRASGQPGRPLRLGLRGRQDVAPAPAPELPSSLIAGAVGTEEAVVAFPELSADGVLEHWARA